MAGANYLYRFISSVWDGLPKKEKDRYAELWKGYEQVFADSFQRFLELDQTTNLNSMPVYMSTRWNRYTYDNNNSLTVSATFRSYQDLSRNADLNERFLIKIAVDKGEAKEIDCRGVDPQNTTIHEIMQKINQAFGFTFAKGIFEDTLIYLETQTKGPLASIEILPASVEDFDASEIVLGLAREELPVLTPRLPHKYYLSDPKIRKIPSFQNTIRLENLTYYIYEGPDFEINWREGYISFLEKPPEVLWAKVTYLDEEMPFYNYGYLIDYRDPDLSPEEYLQNLRGLWFAFWQGPRPEFIKRALALLFSLPTAIANGVVLTDRGTLLDILHDDGQIVTYGLPSQLKWVVKVGDYVERFELLTDGIDVYDKVNRPGFVQTEIGRDGIDGFAIPGATRGTSETTDESIALQMLEEHTFLPQINVNAFVRPNIELKTVLNFLINIKPLHKAFYFQVIIAVFNEAIDLQEKVGFDYNVDVTPNLEINQANWSLDTVREDYEENQNKKLDLDSDALGFFDRGSLSFSNISGPLSQYDVVF
jgi:hypothetical protein